MSPLFAVSRAGPRFAVAPAGLAVAPAGDVLGDVRGYFTAALNAAADSAQARAEASARRLLATREFEDAVKRAILAATPALQTTLASQAFTTGIAQAATAELRRPENQVLIRQAAESAGRGAAQASVPLLVAVALGGAALGALGSYLLAGRRRA